MIIIDTGIIIETDEIKAKGIVNTMKLPFSRMDDALRISKRVSYDIKSKRAVVNMLNSNARNYQPFPICAVREQYREKASSSCYTRDTDADKQCVMRMQPVSYDIYDIVGKMEWTSSTEMEARKLLAEMSLNAVSVLNDGMSNYYLYEVYFDSKHRVRSIECLAPGTCHEIAVGINYKENISIQKIIEISRELNEIPGSKRCLIRNIV